MKEHNKKGRMEDRNEGTRQKERTTSRNEEAKK